MMAKEFSNMSLGGCGSCARRQRRWKKLWMAALAEGASHEKSSGGGSMMNGIGKSMAEGVAHEGSSGVPEVGQAAT